MVDSSQFRCAFDTGFAGGDSDIVSVLNDSLVEEAALWPVKASIKLS